MAKPNQAPENLPLELVKDDMAIHFLEQKAADPELASTLADRLWGSLTPAQRDLQTAVFAEQFPKDLKAREKAAIGSLLLQHFNEQAEIASSLNNVFEIPAAEVGYIDPQAAA